MTNQEGSISSRNKDLLGRRALAEALAEKLYDHAIGPKDIDPRPTVVTIEGPWGSGKSSLLDLVRDCLPHPQTTAADDDLDRCRPLTTAEVFEAINLFLAGFVSERRGTGRENPGDPGSSLRARFVIGLDPVVVASHLDRVYADLYDPDTVLDGEDPSPGWAFLRKLVHLPGLVPQVSDEAIFRVIDRITGIRTLPTFPPAVSRQLSGSSGWPSQRDPQIQALVHSRLAAQPDRSIREATRQLNLWEFYERVLAFTAPIEDPALARDRSHRIVILAEIVTRWPALQRFLHRRAAACTGLQLLAAAATSDDEWPQVAGAVLAGCETPDEALTTLRQLLRDHDGVGVAGLAAQLL